VDDKLQLRANRRHALNAWLGANHLRMDEAPYWSPTQAAAEEAKFAELDTAYEVAKVALEAALDRLSAAEQLDWFDSVNWAPVGATKAERTADYMARA